MSAQKRTYDSTVARIAGNILSGYRGGPQEEEQDMVVFAVNLARAIVAEVERTEPKAQPQSPADIQRAHLQEFGK